MKVQVNVRRGAAWAAFAEFYDPAHWGETQAAERARVELYDEERKHELKLQEQAHENRRLAQRVALERKEVPPADLEEEELPFARPELTKEQRQPRVSFTCEEFDALHAPGGYTKLVATTALALQQNKWADEVRVELVEEKER